MFEKDRLRQKILDLKKTQESLMTCVKIYQKEEDIYRERNEYLEEKLTKQNKTIADQQVTIENQRLLIDKLKGRN